MLKKKVNIKGLRKKILNLEYEKFLLACPTNVSKENLTPLLDRESTQASSNSKFRILILRTEPLKTKQEVKTLVGLDTNVTSEARVHSKCIKKNVLKKVVFPLVKNNTLTKETWLKCKYIYWMTPDATSLKEQLIQLTMLKSYVRAEPRDAFLGCLIESGSDVVPSKDTTSNFFYKYYYPAQIINLCDSIEKLSTSPSQATGLEILGHLLHTIDSSVNSLSNILAHKNKSFDISNDAEKDSN